MSHTIDILENALRAWEDIFLLEEATTRQNIRNGLRKPEHLVGPIKYWRELRSHLLSIRGHDFDDRKFILPENLNYSPFSTITEDGRRNTYENLPLQLASWILSSRRVFQLSNELIERFIAADYSTYKWSDLLWPFEAFVIQLESPVEAFVDSEDFQIQMLMVTSIHNVCKEGTIDADRTMELGMFFTRRGEGDMPHEFFNQKDRDGLNDAVRNKRWDKLRKRLMPIGQKLINGEFMFPPGSTDPYSVDTSQFVDDSNSAKIIAGLCLYLEALPIHTFQNYGWTESVKARLPRDVRKIITSGELICQVEDFHVLSPETMSLFPETVLKGPAYTVTPHWRRGHYRRARGQGNNPDAPRDVYVKPALIHQDQVPQGAVPGGAISSVK